VDIRVCFDHLVVLSIPEEYIEKAHGFIVPFSHFALFVALLTIFDLVSFSILAAL
jgi:hypothetical protein